ncbi:hypothetical protein [Pandoraea sputorum]|uniref:Uncharacterized protein n=1 Tax=Pandoraea sputorum TaxID=93222 RepID=A0A239SU74_9BURK|nr:hypothetical protein [Pandoraea sputorum]AJC18359.1 hypothetical protein NA29_24730 [Pandoraea sputorum]BET11587.1 hypothetical protein THI4931_26290 [Pandoraea sputorum]SNU88203.1 Uncharacterised protein [Pandoraea sputorum]VVE53659.1 hypothetical protein PSP20601_04852 [Pandoraea sputorum]
MKPAIRLEYLHHQCQRLIYEDEFGIVEGVVEYGVDGGLLLWESDFHCSAERRARLIAETEEYMAAQGGRCAVLRGKSRI